MMGAVSTSPGCTVQEMGTLPRLASAHFVTSRCSSSCMLSPSLMKIATYALFARVGVGGGAGGWIVYGTAPRTVRLVEKSAAKTGTPYVDVMVTPLPSSGHQPAYGEFGCRLERKPARIPFCVASRGSSQTTIACVATA